MLSSEGYANDGKAKKKSKKEMGEGDPDSCTEEPDNICNRLQTTSG